MSTVWMPAALAEASAGPTQVAGTTTEMIAFGLPSSACCIAASSAAWVGALAGKILTVQPSLAPMALMRCAA
jgi:hypothetical protein